jgi:restriction endonuclease S subunit
VHIGTVDADGVALAAIQGLHELVREKDAEIEELKARLERLEKHLLIDGD